MIEIKKTVNIHDLCWQRYHWQIYQQFKILKLTTTTKKLVGYKKFAFYYKCTHNIEQPKILPYEEESILDSILQYRFLIILLFILFLLRIKDEQSASPFGWAYKSKLPLHSRETQPCLVYYTYRRQYLFSADYIVEDFN